MIVPVMKDSVLVADVRAALARPGELHVWWLGQSGFLVQWQGRHLLFDPYLSDSLTRKYAATDKPHTRMTELVIPPDKLDFIDVVTSSHNHTDHLDAETLVPLFAVNPALRLIAPAANRGFIAERLGRPMDDPAIIGLDDGTEACVAGFTFTGMPAAHESLDQDEQGRHRYLGYIVRFGPWTLYHSGDTMDYPGLAGRLSKERVNLAFLPINGRAPERRVAGNLSGPEAARIARQGGIGTVIPCHYEMFSFNTASPDAFVRECTRLGQSHKVLRAGERLDLKP
jgi:L-ascorbate metabolism protein UlaG (beta-lactamase superfamily)